MIYVKRSTDTIIKDTEAMSLFFISISIVHAEAPSI